jgi:dTDP-D-glucose 4,6-dehydratase
VSTDEVYGESSLGKESGCDETSSLEPTNPYSAAKAGAEMMVRSYMTSYKMPCIITRGNNVYGPHQFPEKLIPKMTLLAARGKDLPVHGNGGAVRSYLHVRDVARAFDTVLHKGVVGEVYNIGTQKERSVLEVVKAIAQHMNVSMDRIKHVEDRAFNDQRCGPLLCASQHIAHSNQSASACCTALCLRCAQLFDRASESGACIFKSNCYGSSGQGRQLQGYAPMIAIPCIARAELLFCRYFICDKKLLALGWQEEETWEEGLVETINWYLEHGSREYWENGNMEAALVPHPTLAGSVSNK